MIETTVPDIYELSFMPGQFRCPQCGFQLSKQTISTTECQIGTTESNRQSEPCPNDGTMMVHVTYREQLEGYAERLKDEFSRYDKLKETAQTLHDALTASNEVLDEIARDAWNSNRNQIARNAERRFGLNEIVIARCAMENL